MPNVKYDRFIFTHIPKCGGMSFRKILRNSAVLSQVPSEEVYLPGFYGVDYGQDVPTLTRDDLAIWKMKQYRIVGDHSPYGFLNDINDIYSSAFYYTILRDPVERFISQYNFCCYHRGDRGLKGVHLNDLTEEVLDRELEIGSNMIIYFVSGFYDRFSVVTYQIARENLIKKFACFGILCDFERSFDLLNARLPKWLSLANIRPFLNRSKSSKRKISTSIIEKIHGKNELDIEFYRWAYSVFVMN